MMRAPPPAFLVLPVLAAVLSACTSITADPVTGLYAKPIGNAPATANLTPYSNDLVCLHTKALSAQKPRPRVAVGRIEDLTGKRDFYTGANITQGIALFAQSALSRAGLPQVERGDRDISDYELKAAMERVLSDTPEQAGSDPDNFRKVYTGQVAGSDYYLSGGLTELNYNILSDGVDLRVGGTGENDPAGAFVSSRFVMNIALDLRLIDTRSQEIRRVTAYQKQITGREVKPGVFALLDGTMLDLSGGFSEMEPVQLGVRTLIERSVYDMAAALYGMDASVCRVDGSMQAAGETQGTPEPRPVYEGRYLNRGGWRSTGAPQGN